MELRENACNVTVTLPNRGILDRRKYGEALGKGKGLCTGIPDYLPKNNDIYSFEPILGDTIGFQPGKSYVG